MHYVASLSGCFDMATHHQVSPHLPRTLGQQATEYEIKYS